MRVPGVFYAQNQMQDVSIVSSEVNSAGFGQKKRSFLGDFGQKKRRKIGLKTR